MELVDAAFYLKDATVGAGSAFRGTVVRLCLSCCTVIVLLWVAILMYISFYYAYMPTVHHSQPVYLQFSPDCYNKPDDGLCSFPEANVTLSKGDRILMRGQRYQVFLDLEMPQSPVNEKLGMFMVTLKFLSHSGKVLATSSRSSMLHFKSGFLKGLSTMFLSFPLIFGFSEESQMVAVKLFENYVDDSYHPVTKINVVISARKIEIYGAALRIEAEFSGFRYILFNYPITSALICISTNFITACIIFFFAYHAFTPDTIETEPDTVQVDADGHQHLYSEARRRDLRRRSPERRIARTPSPLPIAGRFRVRTLYTRNKAPNMNNSLSSSHFEPIENHSVRRRLRSASFPPCRWDNRDRQTMASEDIPETVRGAPSTSRGGSEAVYFDIPKSGIQAIPDDHDIDMGRNQGYKGNPEVDNIHPLTYASTSRPNQRITETNEACDKQRNETRPTPLEKSLSFDSGVQQILPSYTVMQLNDSRKKHVTSTGDIGNQSEMNGQLSQRRIPDGAPAEPSQASVLVRAKSEEQCISTEGKTVIRKRSSPSKGKSKFGSSFRKILPRK